MRSYLALSIAALVLLGAQSVVAQEVDRKQARRAAIDEMARQSIDRLLADSERARGLFDNTVAYAVFDNFKFTFLLSGGGGVGVAVDRTNGSRTYMKMGTGGVGLGLGGQSYQVVFLFENKQTFERFVNKGWQADLAANAVAGTSGKNAPATFTQGLAVFQMTNKGLMAQADISGTKYWKSKKLNQ